jgi:outer membrane protein OmpA-like peptidoglycan-associated protein
VHYNAGLDLETQKLNEVILNNLAETLKKNPKLQIRIEGHANPVTHTPDEVKRLITISNERAYAIARQLRAKGVSEDQMVIAASGGTRTVTNNYDIRYRNRRVELIVIQG